MINIEKICSDFYGDKQDTATDILRKRIIINRGRIVDTLSTHFKGYFQTLESESHELLSKKFSKENKQNLKAKLELIEATESIVLDNPAQDLMQLNCSTDTKLATLYQLANYEETTYKGQNILTTKGIPTSHVLAAIEKICVDIIHEKIVLTDDKNQIINYGISLATVYGYFFKLGSFNDETLYTLAILDDLTITFFFALGRHVLSPETEFNNIEVSLREDKVIEKQNEGRRKTQKRKRQEICKYTHKKIEEQPAMFEAMVGEPLIDLINMLRDDFIKKEKPTYQLEGKKHKIPSGVDAIKPAFREVLGIDTTKTTPDLSFFKIHN